MKTYIAMPRRMPKTALSKTLPVLLALLDTDAQHEQRIELTNTKRPCRATGKVCRTFRISTRKEIE